MNKIFVGLLVGFLGFATVEGAGYCEGYERGYKDGYEKAVGVPGLDPTVPICPPQPISIFDNPDQKYQIGYKHGHKDGYEKAKKKGEQ